MEPVYSPLRNKRCKCTAQSPRLEVNTADTTTAYGVSVPGTNGPTENRWRIRGEQSSKAEHEPRGACPLGHVPAGIN